VGNVADGNMGRSMTPDKISYRFTQTDITIHQSILKNLHTTTIIFLKERKTQDLQKRGTERKRWKSMERYTEQKQEGGIERLKKIGKGRTNIEEKCS